LICFAELIDCFGVMSEIFFTTNEDDGQARAEMRNFVDPLLLYAIERVWRVDRKGNKDDVRAGITEGSETIEVFLTEGIPQRQLNLLASDVDVCDIVLEHVGLVALQFR